MKRFLYGLAGATLTGVVTWLADGNVFTWKGLGVVAAGSVAGYIGTGVKKSAQ